MHPNTQIIIVVLSVPWGRNGREEERVEDGWRAGQTHAREVLAKLKHGKIATKALLFKVLKGSAFFQMGCGCLDNNPSTVYIESCSLI